MWLWCPPAAFVKYLRPSGTCPLRRGRPGLRGCQGLRPLPPRSSGAANLQLYLLGSRRRDWRAGYHCGSARKAGRHSAQAGGAQGPHTFLCPWTRHLRSVWLEDTTQQSTSRKRMLFFPKPSKGVPANGHTGALAPGKLGEAWATPGASLQALVVGVHRARPTQ